MSSRRSPMLILCVTTLAFLVCFVVWMMFGVLGIELRTVA
ncbi:major facilitator transporter [Caballeronia choica]|uniref:Major facilitator transporter n=1 Tax=Caballeronia choica TaxID=326476 RepID=A0A158KQ33_9BURK|nr:major facilitator transporter [Caballeronia choica]